ncbi:DoxX family protein [Chitinophaga rhizophila]|uniref:DoxX family protein n=1 Tax=Chitinophaga rhizophila TaxID=2866212 RepID=A0ABS7GEK4_9BACT|nr:DoxX family protein [Chitinophaga rhizophila]MBW8685710.1 DoxX family protein [Chitinophaga rhizophila]
MTHPANLLPPQTWKASWKVLFRFFFIYFVIQCVPLDIRYYTDLLHIQWTELSFRDIFYLTRYTPRFIPGEGAFGSFTDWGIAAFIALTGTLVWTYLDRQRKEYNQLYYWLRAIVRYRLAIGVIAYGLLKLFPQQLPYPSISQLNTHYGDLSAWKIFAMSTGVVPSMETFLGLVETIAGLLLLSRRTATIGAGIIITFTGNVFMSNLAYEGGEYVYSFYLVILALFLLSYDILRIINLLTLERPTAPGNIRPYLPHPWHRAAKLAVKALFIFFFFGLYGYKTYASYRQLGYQYPHTPGLKEAAGIYNVTTFRINNQELPYSLTDSVRWKDVVFETWATISIRANRYVHPDLANTEEIFTNDPDRNYELAGSVSRHYYSYNIDTSRQLLVMYNKNKYHQQEKLVLQYTRPDSNRIILSGSNERHDTLYVVLDKIDKKYPLIIGRRKPLQL